MEVAEHNVVVVNGEQWLVTSTTNGVHGRRCTEEELAEGVDLGGRDVVYLGTVDELEAKGARVFALD